MRLTVTWLSLPHVAQDLYVASDLLLGADDVVFLQVVDEELIAPATPSAGLGICGKGGGPVFAEA